MRASARREAVVHRQHRRRCAGHEDGRRHDQGVGLELGGKSSIIVFDDADLDHAVELVTGGGLFNAGQMCSATSRVLVAAPLADDLIARLARRFDATVVGPPFAPACRWAR